MTQHPAYITAKDACAALGYRSTRMVSMWCRDPSTRPPGAYKAGGQWMIPAEWVEQQKQVRARPHAGQAERPPSAPDTPHADASIYMTTAEASHALGYRTTRTLLHMCARPETTPEGAYKLGSVWMIPRAWVDARREEMTAQGTLPDGTPGRKPGPHAKKRARKKYVPTGKSPGRPRKE